MYFWENKQVRLRSFEEEDYAKIAETYTDTDFRMQAECGIGLPGSMEDAQDFIAFACERTNAGNGIWLAIETTGCKFVGYGSLTQIEERHGCAQVSVSIFPEEQNKGYGKAALWLLLKYAFYERRLHKVDCHLLCCNKCGIALAECAGFSLECRRREMYYSHGRYCDELLYGMTFQEFKALEREKQGGLGESVNQYSGYKSHGVMAERCLEHNHIGKNRDELFAARKNFWQYRDIRLRQTREEDLEFMLDILYDSEGCRYFYHDVTLPEGVSGIRESIEEHYYFGGEDGRLEFTITDLTGEYVGNINLFSMDDKNGKFSLSIYIHKDKRGKGYGSQALLLILSYCFMELRFHKFVVAVDEGNPASEQIMRKAGCTLEGVHRECVYYNGNYVNEKFLGVTKEEFLAF